MKAAIYCRLSEEDKYKPNKSSESIQNQRSMLISYARENGWDVYDIYCDENFSGIDSERPEYNRLLNDAKNHRFDIILCKTQSRFSRNMEHIERYLNGLFQEWGIRFISLLDNVDTDAKQSKKSRQINGLINEWYLEDLSDNVKAVLKNKHKDGKSTRPFMPYGLKKSSVDKNKIEIDTEAAEVVRKIFSLFLMGNSAREIARILNSQNILSPQQYKKEKGERLYIPKKSADPKWSSQAVLRTIKNPMYAGDLVHNIYTKPSYKSKHIIKNKSKNWDIFANSHPAIVSRADFEKANSMLKKSRQTPDVECGVCGEKMYRVQKKSGQKQYVYFVCKKCGLSANCRIAEPFLDQKYEKRIKKIVISSKYSSEIFFNRF